jgi:hypothetical protein
MSNQQAALELARIHRRFALFRERIDQRCHGRRMRHINRHLDLWFHYLTRATAQLPQLTVREQLEAFGWTRVGGQTVRKRDGARPANVPCDPAVSQVQQWILMGCPAEVRSV